MTDSNLKVRPFTKADYSEYRSWFQDPLLQKALGPTPDQEWLDCVLNDNGHHQLSICKAQQLVAVAGVCLPAQDHPSYTITDIAILPARRQEGIGQRVMGRVIKEYALQEGQYWQAFVEIENTIAQSFFESLQWQRDAEPDSDGMFRFEFRATNSTKQSR